MNSASLITLLFMVCFFAIMLWIGLRARRHAGDIDGFVLGSRQVGQQQPYRHSDRFRC